MIIDDLVRTHNLIPHPEGGFYRETYRSDFSTGIFYLLTAGHKSNLHRIKSDEMWHFYSGDEIVVVEIKTDGTVKETYLNASNVQYVVPANTWFGAYLPINSRFALTGCTVAPAFDFKDFELADSSTLIEKFPNAKEIIIKLSP